MIDCIFLQVQKSYSNLRAISLLSRNILLCAQFISPHWPNSDWRLPIVRRLFKNRSRKIQAYTHWCVYMEPIWKHMSWKICNHICLAIERRFISKSDIELLNWETLNCLKVFNRGDKIISKISNFWYFLLIETVMIIRHEYII